MTRSMTAQLAAPDPDGAAIALYRTRAYRFTDDPQHYVLAEVLEERYAQGDNPSPNALAYLHANIDQIRTTGQLLPFSTDIAGSEGIDVQRELDARAPYAPRPMPRYTPRTLVFIIGAPRSGTSHLYNVLASTGRYAYFTTASCWAWPVRNLTHPARTSFEPISEAVLAVDNKNTRLIPGLVMPYEAEDLYARTIPTYRHLGGHTYDLNPAILLDPVTLTSNIQAHCAHFGRPAFLSKSPFNSLRIPQLEAATGNRAIYLNITRDQAGTADSMRRNRFRFQRDGRALTEDEAWELFTDATKAAPAERTIDIAHHALIEDARGEVDRIERSLAAIRK